MSNERAWLGMEANLKGMTHDRFLTPKSARCTLSREIVGSALFAGHVETRVATGMRIRRTYLTWFDGDVVEACMSIQCHHGRVERSN